MSGLPKGWVETEFGDVFDFKGGSQPPKSEFYSEPGEGRVRLLQIRDFASDEKAVYIRDNGKWPKCSAADVMIGRYGASVGKILSGKAGAYNVALVKLEFPQMEIDRRWVQAYLKTDHFQRPLFQISRSAQNGFNKEDLKEVPVPIPPLAEQKRIVAKLEALNAKSARARTALARIETLVSRYKQAVLSKAFSGALTASFERGNSAALLDTDSDVDQLWSLPETWTWCRTDQIGRVGLGRQRSPKNHEGPQMRPYLRSANITWAGVDTSDVKEMNFDDADFKRFKLEVGDLLLNEGSGSAKEVGKPAIWRGEIADCCYQNTLLRVQPHRCSSEYAYYYFLLTARAGRFVSSTQGVNIQHIGREGLACYPFPLAPEPEQHEIVRRIESAFAKIDRLAAEAKRALALVGRLDEAVLAKAFRGELVPQDENDEPAATLLARIRAEREAAPKVTRGRKARS